jgi:hypothetical protein
MPSLDVHTENLVYLTDLEQGWYALTNPRQGAGIGMVWPKEIFPYIWFWQNYHGGPGYMWYRRHYNVGIEPWTSIPSNGLLEAIRRRTARRLEGGASVSLEWRTVVYAGMKGVRAIEADGTVVPK